MNHADSGLDTFKQPANETIDRLCFTIQRQSAMCQELVELAVEAERRLCAEIAETDESGSPVAARIATKIRAHSEPIPVLTAAKVQAAR